MRSRCTSCGQFFAPHPRVGARQKTCGGAQCKLANRQRQEASWREREREHVRSYAQDYRDAHREDLRSYDLNYYYKHRSAIRGRKIPYQRKYRRDNRVELKTKQSARYWRNPQACKEQMRAYRNNNRRALAEYTRQRRQLLKALPGISLEQFSILKRSRP